MKLGKMVEEVLKHLNKKPATVLYPFEKLEMPGEFRGRIIYSSEKCVGCRLCEKDCPAFAIKIIKVGEKKFDAKIDLDRCIFCAQCVESCNKKALLLSSEYELAEIDPIIARIVVHKLL